MTFESRWLSSLGDLRVSVTFESRWRGRKVKDTDLVPCREKTSRQGKELRRRKGKEWNPSKTETKRPRKNPDQRPKPPHPNLLLGRLEETLSLIGNETVSIVEVTRKRIRTTTVTYRPPDRKYQVPNGGRQKSTMRPSLRIQSVDQSPSRSRGRTSGGPSDHLVSWHPSYLHVHCKEGFIWGGFLVLQSTWTTIPVSPGTFLGLWGSRGSRMCFIY